MPPMTEMMPFEKNKIASLLLRRRLAVTERVDCYASLWEALQCERYPPTFKISRFFDILLII